jgi:hypothetical protein
MLHQFNYYYISTSSNPSSSPDIPVIDYREAAFDDRLDGFGAINEINYYDTSLVLID